MRACTRCGEVKVATTRGRAVCAGCRIGPAYAEKRHAAAIRPEVVAPWRLLARFDGLPRSGRGRGGPGDWSGRLADRCADRLEAVQAQARHAAAILWAEHSGELLAAGKHPWFLDPPHRAQRSDGRGSNGRRRSCIECAVTIPPTGKRGRPRLRCPDCGGKPWSEDEQVAS